MNGHGEQSTIVKCMDAEITKNGFKSQPQPQALN